MVRLAEVSCFYYSRVLGCVSVSQVGNVWVVYSLRSLWLKSLQTLCTVHCMNLNNILCFYIPTYIFTCMNYFLYYPESSIILLSGEYTNKFKIRQNQKLKSNHSNHKQRSIFQSYPLKILLLEVIHILKNEHILVNLYISYKHASKL